MRSCAPIDHCNTCCTCPVGPAKSGSAKISGAPDTNSTERGQAMHLFENAIFNEAFEMLRSHGYDLEPRPKDPNGHFCLRSSLRQRRVRSKSWKQSFGPLTWRSSILSDITSTELRRLPLPPVGISASFKFIQASPVEEAAKDTALRRR